MAAGELDVETGSVVLVFGTGTGVDLTVVLAAVAVGTEVGAVRVAVSDDWVWAGVADGEPTGGAEGAAQAPTTADARTSEASGWYLTPPACAA